APAKPPYLAILSKFTTAPGVVIDGKLRYTVKELSGTLGIDRTLTSNPGDTLILSLPPATYVVELHDIPATCSVRDGPARLIVLLDSDNTGTLRFNVSCVSSLRIEVLMDGNELDTELVYHLQGPGTDKLGLVKLAGPDSIHARGDTIVLTDLAKGDYQISLAHISENCGLFGDDVSRVRTVSVSETGGADVSFRVRCSEMALRPHLHSLASTYHDNTSGFVFSVFDPDRDVRSYRWDLTDCQGKSVLPEGRGRIRRGLDGGRTLRADSMVIVGAFEVGIADGDLVGRCTAIVVEDIRGNISDMIEQPIAASRGGTLPDATLFNARLIGTSAISTQLQAFDLDGDFAGSFAAVRVRDGILSASDGNPDIGILSPVGFLDTTVPNLPLGTLLKWDDVFSIIVYLIDSKGNFRRLEDADLFH
ncbi:MAG TPA: hypothetical protein VFT29_08190, partial [Gemmatimonadaceae bacterium]|nr:hypothetical protein [Gemmatimonadaceae bacterium]